MFYFYIVTNKRNGTLYTGHTDDLANRIEAHRQKVFKGFSSRYNCYHLVWFETHPSREDAFKRERQIKEWKRAWKIELIENDNPEWFDISLLPTWPIPKENLLDLSTARLSR